MRKKMPGYGTHAPHIQAVENSDPSAVRAPIPKNFFAIVYSAAFLLSLGGGFLSGKTSYIIVNLFADQNCVGVKSDQCNDALNKYTEASAVTTFTSLGFALVVVPFLTRASDAFGRRIFIQVGSVMVCWSVSIVLYEFTGWKSSLYLVFVLSFVASQSPIGTVSVSSILDVCPSADKSTVLGRRAALFVLGNCVGLAISYALSDLQASIACLVCMSLSVFVHVFYWPETLVNRIPQSKGNLNPFRPLLFFFNKQSYRYLFFVMLVEQLAGSGFNALIFNYAVKAFNAGPSIITAALTTFTLASATMPGVLLPILQVKLKCSDFLLIRIGLIGMAASFTLISFFENLYCFFGACIMLGFGGLISPAAMSIVSRRTSDKDQGLAQGAFSANASLSSILAQVIFDALFILGNTQYNSAGFAFYFAFAFCLIALACAIGFERSLINQKDEPDAEGEDVKQSVSGQSLFEDGTYNADYTLQ